MELLPILTTLLLAVVFLVVPKLNYAAKSLGTIVHELGHAFVVMPFGGRLHGIKLQANTEGEAVVGIPRYPFPFYQILRIINLFAGYGAPIYLSLGLFAGFFFDKPTALMITLGVMSLVVLLFIRNLFGILIATSFGVLNAVFIFLLPQFILWYALGLSLVLLVRGTIDIVNIAKWTFGSKLPSSDFVLAAEELGGSPRLWFVIFCIFHLLVLGFLAFMWATS